MPKLLGVTGGFGAGKSAVGEILRSCGIVVIDSDDIVHALLNECRVIKSAVSIRFGSEVLDTDGSINRKVLAGIVFPAPAARKDLESIVHPAVRDAVKKKLQEHANEPLIALLIPLLFESGMEAMFDEIWSVDCPYYRCLQRVAERSNLTKEEIDQRISAQLPQKEKNSRAHAVIDNSGTLDQTRAQVVKLLHKGLSTSTAE